MIIIIAIYIYIIIYRLLLLLLYLYYYCIIVILIIDIIIAMTRSFVPLRLYIFFFVTDFISYRGHVFATAQHVNLSSAEDIIGGQVDVGLSPPRLLPSGTLEADLDVVLVSLGAVVGRENAEELPVDQLLPGDFLQVAPTNAFHSRDTTAGVLYRLHRQAPEYAIAVARGHVNIYRDASIMSHAKC